MFQKFACAAVCSLGLWCSTAAIAYPPVAVHAHSYFNYHRQAQSLDTQIRLQEAEVAMLERVLVEWEPLDRFRGSRVLGLDIERTRLALAEEKLWLECLRQQKFDLVRSRGRGW